MLPTFLLAVVEEEEMEDGSDDKGNEMTTEKTRTRRKRVGGWIMLAKWKF